MDMTAARQGDHVRVYQQDRQRPCASDRWFDGTVTKTSASWLWVSFDTGSAHRTLHFLLSSGEATDDRYYGRYYVMTVEEALERAERSKAEDALRKIGLQFTSSGRRDEIPLPVLRALAAVVETGVGQNVAVVEDEAQKIFGAQDGLSLLQGIALAGRKTNIALKPNDRRQVSRPGDL